MLCLGHHRDTFQHVLAFNMVAPVLTSHVEFARDHGFDSLADSVEHQPRVLQVSNLHAYMSQPFRCLWKLSRDVPFNDSRTSRFACS